MDLPVVINGLTDIFELRNLLGPQIARLAAKRITPEQVRALKDNVQLQKENLEDRKIQATLDDQFSFPDRPGSREYGSQRAV